MDLIQVHNIHRVLGVEDVLGLSAPAFCLCAELSGGGPFKDPPQLLLDEAIEAVGL